MSNPRGFGHPDQRPINQVPTVTESVDAAIALIITAMDTEGGLTEQQRALLLNKGLIPDQDTTLYSALDNITAMINAIQRKMMYGSELLITDPKEIQQYTMTLTKLMEMVRKATSEARRIEELNALETCMLQMVEEVSNLVDPSDSNYERMHTVFANLKADYESNLRSIANKFDA